MFKKMFLSIPILLIVVLTVFLSVLFVKGDRGNPIAFQTTHDTKVEGPYESTNSTSRYALTESIVENGTFFFTQTQARFSAPDLVAHNGRFFSIFTPGVSFVGVPFYVLGKQLGVPQLFTYFSTHIIALINVFLIVLLTLKLGGKRYHGIIAGVIFLFATNALPYAMTFTQHHLSTMIILLGILNALAKRTFINNIVFGLLFGAGILMDIPNPFLLLPAALYVFYKNFTVEELSEKVKIGIKTGVIGLVIGLIPFIMVYGWYNYQTTGSYTNIAQFIGRSDYPPPIKQIAKKDVKVEEKNPQPKLFEIPFDSRLQFNGFYILLISNERGIFYYSPILLLGILGLFISARNTKYRTGSVLVFSVIGMNVLLYSMFGDPWGGWSYGARYLIPTAALLSAGVGIAVWRYAKNPLFTVLFFVLLAYSVTITLTGALTTNAIPPKGESENLTVPIPYSYEYNFEFINRGQSSSLIYNLFLIDSIYLRNFLYIVTGATIVLIGSIYYMSVMRSGKEKAV